MSEPFMGQIIMFGGQWTIQNFMQCTGASVHIHQNQALYSILGTTYGGDGRTTFMLPDLRGRAPVQHGNGPGLTHRHIGQTWGSDHLALGEAHLPTHSHGVEYGGSQDGGGLTVQTTGADQNAPSSSSYFAGYGQGSAPVQMYTDSTGNEQDIQGVTGGFNPDDLNIKTTGGGQAFDPSGPRLAISFQIAMQGTYPAHST